MPGRSRASSSATADPAEHEWRPTFRGRPPSVRGLFRARARGRPSRGDRKSCSARRSRRGPGGREEGRCTRARGPAARRGATRRRVPPFRGGRGSSVSRRAFPERRRWRRARRGRERLPRCRNSSTIGTAAVQRREELGTGVRRRSEARREETRRCARRRDASQEAPRKRRAGRRHPGEESPRRARHGVGSRSIREARERRGPAGPSCRRARPLRPALGRTSGRRGGPSGPSSVRG